jgi:predicted DNA-binding transcriptional regulator AlpA
MEAEKDIYEVVFSKNDLALIDRGTVSTLLGFNNKTTFTNFVYKNPDFPKPFRRGAVGFLWRVGDIKRWFATSGPNEPLTCALQAPIGKKVEQVQQLNKRPVGRPRKDAKAI